MSTVPYLTTSGPGWDLEMFAHYRGQPYPPAIQTTAPGVPFKVQAQPLSSTLEDINTSPAEVMQMAHPVEPNPLYMSHAKFKGTTQVQINEGHPGYQGVNDALFTWS